MEERGWFSSYGRSREGKKKRRGVKRLGYLVQDLHMVMVEKLCISISNGPMSSGAGPDWESRDCIHCVVCL